MAGSLITITMDKLKYTAEILKLVKVNTVGCTQDHTLVQESVLVRKPLKFKTNKIFYLC